MKREGDHHQVLDHSIAMANCLMLLSRGAGHQFGPPIIASSHDADVDSHHRVFECKTCNRQFPSFQALGGHRASHKKLRPAIAGLDGEMHVLHDVAAKPKTHECSICGVEFAIGQALGGHMRRHRSAATTLNNNVQNKTIKTTALSGSSDGSGSCLDSDNQVHSSGENKKRILILDLNLTPLENDLEF